MEITPWGGSNRAKVIIVNKVRREGRRKAIQYTLISEPPARLWSSSTDAREVSLIWLSASPKVISSSFWSAFGVSSVLKSDFSAKAASSFPVEPVEVETWACCQTCLKLSKRSSQIFSPFPTDSTKKKLKTTGLNPYRIRFHSPEYDVDHLC